MKKSELKKLIKESIRDIIKEQEEIPEQNDILDALFQSYKDNGLVDIEYNEAELQSVDAGLQRNLKAWKVAGDEIIKFLELYGRTYELD